MSGTSRCCFHTGLLHPTLTVLPRLSRAFLIHTYLRQAGPHFDAFLMYSVRACLSCPCLHTPRTRPLTSAMDPGKLRLPRRRLAPELGLPHEPAAGAVPAVEGENTTSRASMHTHYRIGHRIKPFRNPTVTNTYPSGYSCR